MSEYKLAAENRSDAGKGVARRLRATGRVPAVLYGHGTRPQHLSVDARQLGQALRTDAGANVLISLEVGRDKHLALAKEIQRHPVRATSSTSTSSRSAGARRSTSRCRCAWSGRRPGSARAASPTRTCTSSTSRPR